MVTTTQRIKNNAVTLPNVRRNGTYDSCEDKCSNTYTKVRIMMTVAHTKINAVTLVQR